MSPTDTTTINNTLTTTLFHSAILFLAVFILLQLVTWFRKKNEKEHQYKLTFFQILIPKDNEIETKAAEHMF